MPDELMVQPEFLTRLKEKLAANPYTDKQLDRTSWFMVGPVMQVAQEIGAADSSAASIFTTTNLYAAAVLADFINAGCVSVSAINRFMEKLDKETNVPTEQGSE